MSDAADGYAGFASASDRGADINPQALLIKRLLAQTHTAMPVKVLAVQTGDIGPSGTVDVLPLVNQVDGAGQATPHGTVHGLPYFRVAAGASAVILDPVVGDIGLAVFASRDVSAVKATRDQANPGSFRRNSMADGFYFGGFMTQAPTQYVRLGSDGITLTSTVAVTINAPTVTINADAVKNNGRDIGLHHRHQSVQLGNDTSGEPV